MQKEKNIDNVDLGKARKSKLIIYLFILALIFILAVASYFSTHASPVSMCEHIIIQQNKISCFQNLAYSTGNASVCNYLSGEYKAMCYQSLAYKLGNESLCLDALSSYEPVGEECIVHFVNLTGEVSFCNPLPYSAQQHCAFVGAISSQNASACKFAGENASICNSSIILSKALLFKNISYCYNIPSTGNSIIFGSILMNSKIKPNATIIEFASSLLSVGYNISPRSICIISVAQELGNSTYCSQLSGLDQSLCYRVVSPAPLHQEVNYTAMLQACENAGSFKNTCKQLVLISEAVATKNINICRSLANQSASWECFSTLAKTYKNASYCSYISNITVNNACILGVTHNMS
ncbi:MAG: hypothetical protein ACP5P2_01600 [Candidatus Micrarchaeia archaeon]|jgi:flagellar basal body-associated protein FliL